MQNIVFIEAIIIPLIYTRKSTSLQLLSWAILRHKDAS